MIKKKIIKEHQLIQKLLKKQQKDRQKILKKVPHLLKIWKSQWDWDEEAFFDDCTTNVENLLSELTNNGVKYE